MYTFTWTCPYCGHVQAVTDQKQNLSVARVAVLSKKHPNLAVRVGAIGCANPQCDEVQITAVVGQHTAPPSGGAVTFRYPVSKHRLRPDSSAKPQPDYIPSPIRADYEEACRIRDLSPKASATLSRRCLQGMIRDFCGIRKNRLVDEIENLREAVESGSAPQGVSADSMDAIDGLRKIGNIGAHMEKDINLIVDVDPNEAQALIELIESLFEDWYVARQKRQERFAKVAAVATQKSASKSKVAEGSDPDLASQPERASGGE